MDDQVKKQLMARDTGHDIECRLESSREISRMYEGEIKTIEQLDACKIIHPGMADREVLDAFRGLRAKLFGMNQGEGFVVMVSPVVPSSGGSFVASNLAAAIALDDTKTALLVDSDIRNPGLHKLLDVDCGFGLTEYIENAGEVSVQQLIRPTGIPRLRLVSAGQQHETVCDYFTSVYMEIFLNEVRSRYRERFVVIDAPSVLESPDARILADLSDAVILCVGYAKSTRRQIAEAAAEIHRDKLAGVIFSEGN